MSKNPVYMVHWKARALPPNKVMREGVISQVSKGGLSLEIPYAVSTGSQLSVEFYVNYKNEPKRIRAHTSVTYCMLKSQGQGSFLRLSITKISKGDLHALNNVLQILGDSDEFNLEV